MVHTALTRCHSPGWRLMLTLWYDMHSTATKHAVATSLVRVLESWNIVPCPRVASLPILGVMGVASPVIL
jgi:hypothetical protein